MGRKPSLAPKSVQVSVRLDGELIEQVDQFAASMMKQTPGLVVNRSDVLRMALADFMARQKR